MNATARKGGRRLAALLAVSAIAVLALASGASGAVSLSVVKTKPIPLAAGNSTSVFTSNGYEWFECRGAARALSAGWTETHAPIALIYSHTFNDDGNLGVAVTRPARAIKFRGVALCASGRFAAEARSASGTVRCARGQIALGIPIAGGPFLTEPVASRPVGKGAWTTTGQGEYADAKAVCVAGSAFRQVKLVKRTASFKAGAAATTVKASCAGGRRPISWGYEAGTLPQNEFILPEWSGGMTVPYVSASVPSGARGWSLTFRTPDGAGARTSTPLALHLVCAKPA